MPTSKSLGYWTPRVVLLGCLIAHFTLTFFYCFPNNPIKMEAQPILNRTIGTYFTQNWALFAPNPIQSNQTLLVRCLTQPEAEAAEGGSGLPKEGWSDITMPLFQRRQQNRFSAYDRISRTHTNFLKAFLHGGGALQTLTKACREHDELACKAGNKQLAEIRSHAAAPLAKVASSYCLETTRAGEVTHVAMRVRDVPVRPWSQRGAETVVRPVDFEIGTFPVDREVATTGVLKGSI